MIAIYARKSTEVEESKSIKEQIARGEELAKSLDLPYKVYSEAGVSGTWDIDKRPEFSKMLDDIEAGVITVVYAYHQDRLERSLTTRAIFNDIIRRYNVRLFYDSGEVDLDSDESELQGDMLSAFSKYYVRTSKKRAKASIKRNISEGKAHGITAYGYMADRDKNLVVNPEEAEVVKLIFQLSLEGNGFVSIAKALDERGVKTRYQILSESGVKSKADYLVKDLSTGKTIKKLKKDVIWNPSTVGSILNNRNYIGERVVRGTTYSCPSIIDKDVFDKVETQLKENKKKPGKKADYKYLLQNVLVCSKCGHLLHGRSLEGGRYVYRCLNKRHHYTNRKHCGLRDISGNAVDYIIWQKLFIEKSIANAIKENFSYKKEGAKIDALEEEMSTLRKELTQIKQEKTTLIGSIARGVLSDEDAKGFLATLKSKENDLEFSIKEIKSKIDFTIESQVDIKEISKDLKRIKDDAPLELKQEIIEKYIDKIQIDYTDQAYYIKILYKVNIPYELFVVDTKYNLAIDGRRNTLIPISPTYISLAKSPEGISDDNILKRLVDRCMKYNYDDGTIPFNLPN